MTLPPTYDEVRGALYRRLLGIALSVVSAVCFFLHRYHLGKIFREHANPKGSSDLRNIGEHYGVSSAQGEKDGVVGENGNGGVSRGASGFWVAELLAPDDGRPTSYVVGCVGIGKLRGLPPSYTII